MPLPTKESLHSNPSRQLNQVARLITREFDRKLAPLGVNVAYLPVLGALYENQALSQKQLAELGGIGQPAMAQMLDRMVKEGLVDRATDTVDRRKVMFSLSEAAADRMADIGAQIEAGNAEIFAVLGSDGLETLSSLLKALEANLETKS